MNRLQLGCDAGGSRVRVALAQAPSGRVVAQGDECAAADGGPEPVISLVSRLCPEESQIVAACAGIAKFTRAGVAMRWRAALAAEFPLACIQVVPDYVIAFHGALAQGRGVVVVAGTGSVVYGEDGQGRAVRVGGRGWEFGDEGSGAHLSAEAIRRTLRALDGIASRSALTDAVVAFLGTDDPAELAERARERALAQGRGFLVPLALSLARDGQREAQALYVGAAGWLAAATRAAVERLGLLSADPIDVAAAGGLFEAGQLLEEPYLRVLRRWAPGARLVAPAGPPLWGALRCAAAEPTVH